MDKTKTKYALQSVHRAVRILKSFTPDQVELSVTELARGLNLPKATVYRILASLVKEGLIEKNSKTGKYHLGIEMFRLAWSAVNHRDLRKCALPAMRELSEKTKESVALYIRAKHLRICIEKVEGPHLIRHFVKVGESLPLYCGGAGRLLLAFAPKEECRYLPRVHLF